MPFIQGTIANPTEALPSLVEFLTTNADLIANNMQWTKIRDYTTPAGLPGFFLSAKGLGGNTFYWAGHTVLASDKSYANIIATCLTSYDESVPGDFTKQPSWRKQSSVIMLDPASPMNFTFVANERRVVGTFAATGQNHNFYFGCFNPYGDPRYYPRPLVQMGSARYANRPWGERDSYQRGWLNQVEGESSSSLKMPNYHQLYLPNTDTIFMFVDGYSNWQGRSSQFHGLPLGNSPTLSGMRICSDVTLFYSWEKNKEVLGFLDGVVYTGLSGEGDAPGDVVTAQDGANYLIVRSGWRSELSGIRLV